MTIPKLEPNDRKREFNKYKQLKHLNKKRYISSKLLIYF